MRIAVTSDIHGNLPALKAVLDDIDLFSAEAIYCLGDLTDGAPWNNEVVELIRSRAIPTVMGNHDERIAFDHPVFALSKHSKEEQEARLNTINHTKATLTTANKEFLAALPATIGLTFGKVSILLVHGSAESNEEYIYEQHEEAALIEMMDNQGVVLMVSGHTHLSFIRYLPGDAAFKNKLLINAGSVGRSKETDRKACYLQLTIPDAVEGKGLEAVVPLIRKVSYPISETIEGIRNSDVPDFYAGFLEQSPEI
ncbi:metallophosphatase family protein [Pedobacter sp. KBW06]|uniref:metallophosphoesterase family protein n=1 Tax=Pedobacter sp. KBW06 TaxID=2153359 RepID=UPI000F5909A7|nr:metallophosphoesterase family protein [Pedobacter sp. KBW06]RQO73891.1 metallophosphatase family protein [Pedobacter sp. KBW06]